MTATISKQAHEQEVKLSVLYGVYEAACAVSLAAFHAASAASDLHALYRDHNIYCDAQFRIYLAARDAIRRI